MTIEPRARLRELEKRLKDEPENLGLRVTVAGLLREAGRGADAVELYRSVAIAYRDQGRTQQAIMVCRSILEAEPQDAACKELLDSLVANQPVATTTLAGVQPARAVTGPQAAVRAPTGPHQTQTGPQASQTGPQSTVRAATGPQPTPPPPPARSATGPQPTPPPMPPRLPTERPPTEPTKTSHGRPPTEPTKPSPGRPPTEPTKTSPGQPPVAEAPARRSSFEETPLPKPLPYHVADPTTSSAERVSDPDLSETAPTRPGEEPREPHSTMRDLPLPDATAFANAARRISALVGAVSEDEVETREIARLEPVDADKPSTIPTERVELFEDAEESPTPPPQDGEDERTYPRDLPVGVAPEPVGLANAFFAPLPAKQRTAVLTRFVRRSVKAGIAVIRQGEAGHPLVVVVKGRLDVIAERADGNIVKLGAIDEGDFVGEAALLAHGPSQAQVIAATDAELLVLPARELYEIAGAFPSLWSALKDRAEKRTRELDAKLK